MAGCYHGALTQMELAKTDRLILREMCALDAPDYFDIFGHESVCQYDDFYAITLEQAHENVAQIMTDYAAGAKQLEYAVELPVAQRMIGVLCHTEESQGIYIGFHFNPAFGRAGYATEAARAYLAYLKKHHRKPVYALVDPENAPSIALLERLGFRRVSTRRIRVNGKSKWEMRFAMRAPQQASTKLPEKSKKPQHLQASTA